MIKMEYLLISMDAGDDTYPEDLVNKKYVDALEEALESLGYYVVEKNEYLVK